MLLRLLLIGSGRFSLYVLTVIQGLPDSPGFSQACPSFFSVSNGPPIMTKVPQGYRVPRCPECAQG